jgi:hypothetical protein
MGALLDDVSRIVASPLPRRRAFKLVGAAFGGALFEALGLGRVSRAWGQAQAVSCPKGSTLCGAQCCNSKNQFCCGTGARAVCCSSGDTCCGSTTVGFTCCGPGQTCCGNKCCAPHQSCCGTGSAAICCSSGQTCCGNTTVGFTCCGSGKGCCTDASKPYCAPPQTSCCKGLLCNNGAHQTCCSTGTSAVCCSSGLVCCSGKCCKAGPSPSQPCYGAKCG